MKKTTSIFFLVAFILVSCMPTEKIVPTEKFSPTLTLSPAPTATLLTTPEISSTTISADYLQGLIDTGSKIFITNMGSIAVKNLRIWICTSQINDNWQDIQGVASLRVEPDNLPPKFTQEYHYNDGCLPAGDMNKKTNILLLRFASLPINQRVHIVIKVKPNIKKSERIYKGKVYIKIPNNLNFSSADSVVSYLQKKLSIAELPSVTIMVRHRYSIV
jgi:hypothetical protein